MRPLMPNDPETKSAEILTENIERLKTLFPEAVTEGKIDIDVLKQLLGGVVDEGEEKYGLNWHGKRRARQLALTPSTGTLRPCPEDSVDWDTTQNLMIEGDNLEVLKLLQKSYAGKVKVMCIDPPYNTGKDFVYPDDFQDNIKNYLELTGQVEDGKKISTNTEASGRFHTDWLNMMYPRMKLARNLLRDDGVIFICIDEIEMSNLVSLCNDVFGEENQVCLITREAIKGGSVSKYIRKVHDYVVVYAKTIDELIFSGIEKEDIDLNLEDEFGKYTMGRELNKWGAGSRREDSPSMWFPIKGPNDVDVFPYRNDGSEGRWRLGRERMKKLIETNSIVFEKRQNGTYIAYEKIRAAKTGIKQFTTIFRDEYINAKGTEVLKRLFQTERAPFDFSKPVELICALQILADTSESDFVMDLFTGSGTTGHAVMAQNAADGGNRRYILVQLPEPLDPENKDQKIAADYCDKLKKPRNIAELTKERLRRAAKKIKDENPMFAGDLGFRTFKLDTTNIRTWDPDRENLTKTLLDSVEHLKTDRAEADVLYELLLKLGLDLCVPVQQKDIASKTVYNIGAGTLLVCLAPQISREEVETLAIGIAEWHKALAPAGESTVVFRDSAFADDVAKTNLAAILQQHGLGNVRSL